jgi:hypothetical protein
MSWGTELWVSNLERGGRLKPSNPQPPLRARAPAVAFPLLLAGGRGRGAFLPVPWIFARPREKERRREGECECERANLAVRGSQGESRGAERLTFSSVWRCHSYLSRIVIWERPPVGKVPTGRRSPSVPYPRLPAPLRLSALYMCPTDVCVPARPPARPRKIERERERERERKQEQRTWRLCQTRSFRPPSFSRANVSPRIRQRAAISSSPSPSSPSSPPLPSPPHPPRAFPSPRAVRLGATRLVSPHLTSPHLTSPHLTSPRLALPRLTGRANFSRMRRSRVLRSLWRLRHARFHPGISYLCAVGGRFRCALTDPLVAY